MTITCLFSWCLYQFQLGASPPPLCPSLAALTLWQWKRTFCLVLPVPSGLQDDSSVRVRANFCVHSFIFQGKGKKIVTGYEKVNIDCICLGFMWLSLTWYAFGCTGVYTYACIMLITDLLEDVDLFRAVAKDCFQLSCHDGGLKP